MAATLMDPSIITAVLPADTFALCGAFHPDMEDHVPGVAANDPIRTLVLLGWTGGRQWPAFAASAEARDGERHPLDRWSRRLIDAAASRLNAVAFYPFGGPPHHDFQRWAMRAGPVARSPIGLLIHPTWGLWHAYRGALGFRQRLPLVPTGEAPNPCDQCAGKPCLAACPVGAFTPGSYDVDACTGYLQGNGAADCFMGGCLARRACPIRPPTAYSADQSVFHMNAFALRQG